LFSYYIKTIWTPTRATGGVLGLLFIILTLSTGLLAQEGTGSQGLDTTITLTKTVEVYSYEDLTFTIDNYTVQEGDNIEGILKKQGIWPMVSAPGRDSQLMRLVSELNPAIANLDQISPGQHLYLPQPRAVAPANLENPNSSGDSPATVVTYQLAQDSQSSATVVVRNQNPTPSAPPEEVLPEGTWRLNLEEAAAGAPLDPTGASSNEPSGPVNERPPAAQPMTQAPTATRTQGSSSNEGKVEVTSDGTVYRTVRVKKGDTLERLLRREGMDPDLIYKHLIKLTVSLNPGMKNPNLIIAGAELKIPAMGSYLAEYGHPASNDEVLYAQAANATITDAPTASPPAAGDSGSSRNLKNNNGTPSTPTRYRVDTRRLPAAPLPTADSQNARTVLSVIFTRLGETVSTKGRRFLPLDEPPHFDVDTASMPIIDLANGRHIVLDLSRNLKEDFIGRFRQKYPEYMVFQPSRGEAMTKALARLWPMCGYYRVYDKDQTFEGGKDVKLSISADWLVWPTVDEWNKGQPYVINLAPAQDNGTPLPWIRFLNDHKIEVIDLYAGELIAGASRGATPVNNFTVIDVESDNPSAFAEALVKSFGFSPRVGVHVDLVAGRITTGGESITPGFAPPVFWEAGNTKTILEYGDLTTEDLHALRSNDFLVISSARDSQSVLKSILAALGLKLNGPLILNGDSSGGPSIKLTISGQTFAFNDRTYLFTQVALPDNLTSLDPNQNVVVLKYREVAPIAQGTPTPAAGPAPDTSAQPEEGSAEGGITAEDI
jgi:hypothetical protein